MIFSLYETDDDVDTINKVLTNKQTFDISLRYDVSVSDPTIQIVSDVDLSHYNYAEIEYFNRYYFIDQVERIGSNLYRFHLTCDLIESFKDDIFESEQLNYNQNVDVLFNIVEADVDVDELIRRTGKTSYILTTLGVDNNG